MTCLGSAEGYGLTSPDPEGLLLRPSVVTALVLSAALALTGCTSEPGSNASGSATPVAARPSSTAPSRTTPDAGTPTGAPFTVTAGNVTIPTDSTVAGQRVQLGPVSYVLPAGATFEAPTTGEGSAVHIITLAGGTSPAGTLLVEEGVDNADAIEGYIDGLLAAIAEDAATSTVARVENVTWAPFGTTAAATGSLTPTGPGAAPLDVLSIIGYDAASKSVVTLSINAPAGALAEAPIVTVARTLTLG